MNMKPWMIIFLLATSFLHGQAKLTGTANLQGSFQLTTPYLVSEPFFGIHVNRTPGSPWPGVNPGGSFRTLNATSTKGGIGWANIESSANDSSACPAPGQHTYNWASADAVMDAAQASGMDIVYALANTPQCFATIRNDPKCTIFSGSCDAPGDVNSDGTGTDQNLIAFVTALIERYPYIKYFEIWNEANIQGEWQGSYPQLVRMGQDIGSIVHPYGVKVLSPNYTGMLTGAAGRLSSFLNASANGVTGSQVSDIINVHTYIHVQTDHTPPVPENMPVVVGDVRAVLSAGDAAKPLWSTEYSWGDTYADNFNDPMQRSAFLARSLLLLASENLGRVFWYGWDFDSSDAVSSSSGGLWDSVNTHAYGCNNQGIAYAPSGFLCQPGTAYQQVRSWLVGNTVSSCNGPALPATGIWTCNLAKPNGAAMLAIWTNAPAYVCNGGCPAGTYLPDQKYTSYLTLDDSTVHTITPGTPITIGARPILLQTQ
jgi:hypothetical protein